MWENSETEGKYRYEDNGGGLFTKRREDKTRFFTNGLHQVSDDAHVGPGGVNPNRFPVSNLVGNRRANALDPRGLYADGTFVGRNVDGLLLPSRKENDLTRGMFAFKNVHDFHRELREPNPIHQKPGLGGPNERGPSTVSGPPRAGDSQSSKKFGNYITIKLQEQWTSYWQRPGAILVMRGGPLEQKSAATI